MKASTRLYASRIWAVAILATLSFTAAANAQVRISEFLSNAPGGDEGREYFEISGPANMSLAGYTLIEIEGDATALPNDIGNIDAALDLSGFTLGSNGLLLLRDQSTITVGEIEVPGVLNPAPAPGTTVVFEPAFNPGDYNGDTRVDAADYTVWRDAFGVPDATLNNDSTPDTVGIDDYQTWKSNFGADPVATFLNEGGGLENGSITFAIVQGFTGSIDTDLDTDNDGVLDITPWTSVVDAVGFDEDGPADDLTNVSWAAELGGVEFDGALLSLIGGFGNEPDGYILLDDGNGGTIPAGFDVDEIEPADSDFELFLDFTGGTATSLADLTVLDTSALGPWTLDNALGADPLDPGTLPEIVTVNTDGTLSFIDPTEVAVLPGDIDPSLASSGAAVVFATEDPAFSTTPAELFFLSPGNLNGAGVISGAGPSPPPAALFTTVPEPSTGLLAVVVVAAAGAFRRRVA